MLYSFPVVLGAAFAGLTLKFILKDSTGATVVPSTPITQREIADGDYMAYATLTAAQAQDHYIIIQDNADDSHLAIESIGDSEAVNNSWTVNDETWSMS
jgi:hypothetical protein